MIYLAKTPALIRWLNPHAVWRIPTTEKVLYLTFDDGPIPEVTPWVLDTLQEAGAKATFFCVGDNVRKYPDLYKKIRQEGHTTGNHTFNHLNGWRTPDDVYLDNVAQCAGLVDSSLFRPPYGRMRASQRVVLRRTYKIVMWDVLSGDFDPGISSEKCLHHVVANARHGSVVVLHDSLKANKHLRFVLPRILAHFSGQGYQFEPIVL